jgi:NADH-quinone oxidoreductase subunit L
LVRPARRFRYVAKEHLKESPAVVTVPLIALAIPSVLVGWFAIRALLFGGFFQGAIFVLPAHDVLERIGEEFTGPGAFVLEAFASPLVLLIAAAGAVWAWFLYVKRPELPGLLRQRAGLLYRVLVDKYYFDWFNENVLAPAGRGLGGLLWRVGDQTLIDGAIVNGSARTVGLAAAVTRHLQSGYLYHYAFAMVIGLAVLIGWIVLGS